MTRHIRLSATLLIALAGASPASAGPEDFKTGPVIEAFGPVAPMQEGWSLPTNTALRVSFDAAKAAEPGAFNRTLESGARFINMHAAAGVDPKNINLAIVVHGGAAFDLLAPEAYAKTNDGAVNASAALVKALQDNGVRIILCGQTAAYRDMSSEDLLPDVEVALSAMTAHAQLQADGYTINPF